MCGHWVVLSPLLRSIFARSFVTSVTCSREKTYWDKKSIHKEGKLNVQKLKRTLVSEIMWSQGRSQGRVPGVLEPPFSVMKMDIILRGKKYRNTPFEIPRDDIFVFEEEQKKSNLKRHHMISHLARKHPRRLLLSDILAEWAESHNSTAFDEVCNMLNNY